MKLVPKCFPHLDWVVDIVDEWKEFVVVSEVSSCLCLIGLVMLAFL